MVVFNYAVRAAIILVGVGILGGVFRSPAFSDAIHTSFAWAVIAFGLYRLVSYAVTQWKGRTHDHEDDH
jgi:hypothetical protein